MNSTRFHPMWGTFRAEDPPAPPGDLIPDGKRTTFPGKNPIPLCLPNSSLSVKRTCRPRQIPRNGLPSARTSPRKGRSPCRPRFPMQSRNAPTPGRTIPLHCDSSTALPLTRVENPRDSSALLTLRRFPMP